MNSPKHVEMIKNVTPMVDPRTVEWKEMATKEQLDGMFVKFTAEIDKLRDDLNDVARSLRDGNMIEVDNYKPNKEHLEAQMKAFRERLNQDVRNELLKPKL